MQVLVSGSHGLVGTALSEALAGAGHRVVRLTRTGVTGGDFLPGVRFYAGGAETWSVVMRSHTGTVRFITATHRFDKKPM